MIEVITCEPVVQELQGSKLKSGPVDVRHLEPGSDFGPSHGALPPLHLDVDSQVVASGIPTLLVRCPRLHRDQTFVGLLPRLGCYRHDALLVAFVVGGWQVLAQVPFDGVLPSVANLVELKVDRTLRFILIRPFKYGRQYQSLNKTPHHMVASIATFEGKCLYTRQRDIHFFVS